MFGCTVSDVTRRSNKVFIENVLSRKCILSVAVNSFST